MEPIQMQRCSNEWNESQPQLHAAKALGLRLPLRAATPVLG